MSVESFNEERAQEREQAELIAARHRFQEEVEVKSKPYFEVLHESRILSHLEELAKERSDMSLTMYLHLAGRNYVASAFIGTPDRFRWSEDRIQELVESSDSLGLSLPIGMLHKDGRLEWLEREIVEGSDLARFLRSEDISVDIEGLDLSLSWGLGEDREEEWRQIYLEINELEDGFCIAIGGKALGPEEWKSPEKLQKAIDDAIYLVERFS